MELTQITESTKSSEITLQVGEQSITIAFRWRPHAWTPELETEASSVNSQTQGDFYSKLMAPTLAWVDLQKGGVDLLTGDEFTKGGMEAAIAAVSRVPNNILLAIINKIGEINDPGKKSKSRSDGSFSG